jgi:fatty acid desaturase
MSVVTDTGVFRACRSATAVGKRLCPDTLIYWIDLLLSSTLAVELLFVGATTPFLSFTYIVTMLVAVIALLRATIFIHELSHHKARNCSWFESTWNLLVGYSLTATESDV